MTKPPDIEITTLPREALEDLIVQSYSTQDGMKDLLVKHGGHTWDCFWHTIQGAPSGKCTCGWASSPYNPHNAASVQTLSQLGCMAAVDHVLKCWPPYFQAIWDGSKLFEIRRNDRNFKPGDTVILREWDPIKPKSQSKSPRQISAQITYVTDFEQRPGFVVFGLANKVNLRAT